MPNWDAESGAKTAPCAAPVWAGVWAWSAAFWRVSLLPVHRLAGVRYREIVKRLRQLGFEFDRQAACSHEIWFIPETHRYTTIPNHPGDMSEGTLRAILKQAGVEAEAFLGK